MSTVSTKGTRDEAGASRAESLREFQVLVAQQAEAVLQLKQASSLGVWRRLLFITHTDRRRSAEAAREVQELQAAVLRAAERLSRSALSALGATPTEVQASASEFEAIRRLFDEPRSEQGEKVRAFLARTPSPPRA